MRSHVMRAVAAVGLATAVIEGGRASELDAPRLQSSPACRATRFQTPVFVPPSRLVPSVPGPAERFWFGTPGLWTSLSSSGTWRLGHGPQPLRQRTVWWTREFPAGSHDVPQVRVSGRRLDGVGTLTAGTPTGGRQGPVGDATPFVMVMVNLSAAGCWEIAAELDDARVVYVVEVTRG